MHGKRVGIYIDTRRWRCQGCGKTFMEPLPAINDKREMTNRLVRWIGQQSLKRTYASIAEEVGIDEKTVTNYLYHLEGREAVQYVAMDMLTPYRDAVLATLPDARIAIDKFHVVRMANDALERVRVRRNLLIKAFLGMTC